MKDLKSVPLMDICRPKQWKTISTPDLTETGFPVYGANGKIGFYSEYTHEYSTLMITCRGATCGTVNISEPKSYINGNAMAFDELRTDLVDLKYLFYFLKKRGFDDVISGSAQPQITRQGLASVLVDLPPLETQKHIARVLEQADQLRKQAQQMESELNQLAQSLFLEMFGDPVRNPKRWPVEIFEKHLQTIDSGWSPRCEERQAAEGEWGVLKLGAVTTCTYRESENKKLPPELPPRPRVEVKEGDLLFSRKNTYELVAATAYVRRTQGRIMLSDLIFRLVPRDTVDPIYLWGLLTNPAFRSEVQNLAGGAAGSMPNISKTKLAGKGFPLPGIEIQRKYSKMIRAIWAQLALMKLKAEQLENVFNSLMQRAFKGELTPKANSRAA